MTMIAPADTAAELHAERRFDLLAALLIGAIALLAAVLAVIQLDASQTSMRANLQAARLAADISARIEMSSKASTSQTGSVQETIILRMEATSRQMEGLQTGNEAMMAQGAAEQQAYEKIQSAMADTAASSGGHPLDSYTAGLLSATTAELLTELAEQNRQADLANSASSQSDKAVLGLSFLALAGVLTGLAAVLREGRAGWISLGAAGSMAAGACVMAVLALL
jgi:hypothetical protein